MTSLPETDAVAGSEGPTAASADRQAIPVAPALLRLLRCPACFRSPLSPSMEGESASLTCRCCGSRYPVIAGIPDFLSVIDSDRFPNLGDWYTKLSRLKRWWLEERGRATAASLEHKGWRPSADTMTKYFQLGAVGGSGGNVLDIGCGEGQRAAQFAAKTYFGIDPLLLREQYPFPFVRGVGETLPYLDRSFDVVLSVETLDHVLDPDLFLEECCRVLNPTGALFLFVGLDPSRLDTQTRRERDAAFSTTENDVHLRGILPEYFHDALVDRFARLEVVLDRGYLSVWGWQRTD